ncbi:MAG TPA: DegT/DnrJ/EryC1/StrS family aminotransferase [Chloroflexota bacterium]|jgi:dTDP-4-amino-4,6-dideoxygalactose transaminase|nr:DegT/DnrJ/EryC1/StrS family aminotransferase [Chloroflexota bacterium]
MPMTSIPFNDLKPGIAALRDEIEAAIAEVLDSGRAILGPQVRAFESEFAAYCGVAEGVGVASGTDALYIGLKALEVQPGDEVITVANAGVPPVAAIELANARPVLVDIDPATHTLDAEQLRLAISPRTRAVIAVHLYGQPASMDEIMAVASEHGLRVLEDCAQAHGATYQGRRCGTIGDAAAFSFYPTKNLGAIGDGGMIVTSRLEIASRARLLRQYGWESQYHSVMSGTNSRLDELQAAILRVKLRHLDASNAARKAIADRYTAALGELQPIGHQADRDAVYHLYVVQAPQRDELKHWLEDRHIGTAIHYPEPVHRQPAYAQVRIGQGGLDNTERAARQVLSLPLFPELDDASIESVISACRDFLAVH